MRQVLFDAVILVDYPFFNPGCGVQLCSRHLNSLASVWLFVADKALEIAGYDREFQKLRPFIYCTLRCLINFCCRHNGDQTKVIMYTKAFSKSLIHTQLLTWVSNQSGMVEDANKPNLSTPTAFMGEYFWYLAPFSCFSAIKASLSSILCYAIVTRTREKSYFR